MKNVMKNSHAGKQVPAARRGERLHHQQGCGHHRGLQGGAARTLHAHEDGVRGHPFHMGESGQGIAELQHRA